jgi:uncharacterized protein (DUF362 family)
LKRRDFIKAAGLAGASLATPLKLTKIAEAAAPVDIAVASGGDPAKITRAAIEALGGMGRFIREGEQVVVKPNMAWDRTPEYAANSNPLVVAEVVRMCLEAGASRVRVFDRPVNDPRRAYIQSGIQEACEAAGGEVVHIDRRRFKKISIPGGRALKSWDFYSDVINADALVNVPIAKHHSLAGLTMGIKNWMGIIGRRRNIIHQKLNTALVDITRVIRPRLTVIDAVRILTANGPQGGSLEDVKQMDTVIAGPDQVSVDSYGATLFGMKGEDLGYIRESVEAGLGVADLDLLKIKKVRV